MIVKVEPSILKTKRYTAIMDNGKKYHFGYKGPDGKTGFTYIDGASIAVRDNYRKRHLANPIEKKLIENVIASPSLFAFHLLWGITTSLRENIKYLNNLWKKKHLG